MKVGKEKSALGQESHTDGTNTGFCSMKRTGLFVLPLPPG